MQLYLPLVLSVLLHRLKLRLFLSVFPKYVTQTWWEVSEGTAIRHNTFGLFVSLYPKLIPQGEEGFILIGKIVTRIPHFFQSFVLEPGFPQEGSFYCGLFQACDTGEASRGSCTPYSTANTCLCVTVSFWGSKLEAHCCYTSKPNSLVPYFPLVSMVFSSSLAVYLSYLLIGL